MIRKIQSIHLYYFHAWSNKLNWCFKQNKDKHLKRPCLSLKFESLIQICSNPSGFSCISQHTHIAMFHACIILLHIVWWCLCIDVLATGSAPEEYRDYPNEESYPCIEPSGKQTTIWSYRYNPMFSLLLSFSALRQHVSNCCVLR